MGQVVISLTILTSLCCSSLFIFVFHMSFYGDSEQVFLAAVSNC